MEKPLWAPWRMEFIRGEKPDGCVFCEFAAAPESEDRANLVVHRSAHAFTCQNRYPYNSGHVMVIPRAHVADLAALSPEEHADLGEELRRAVAVVKAVYAPDGLNVGMNLGRAAGAGIPGHLHVHVLPRWNGDTNFMTSIAEVRVLPESLPETLVRLRASWAGAAS